MSLREAYAALQAGEAERALALLDALPALESEQEARRLAWRAQALRGVGRVEEAARVCIDAIRLAKQLGDAAGVEALRGLHTDISRSVAALRTAAEGTRRDLALLDTPSSTLDADGKLRKALALHGADRVAEAVALAAEVAAEAADLREQVLARLALARVAANNDALHEAHRLADAANDENLLTAVAQTARQLGVPLLAPRF